jgi:hypothetical protein
LQKCEIGKASLFTKPLDFSMQPEYLMNTDQTYDLLLQALVDIRKNLAEKMSSLDEHIRRVQLECFENAFQHQKEALTDCLEGIDQQLIKLSVYAEEYQRLRASLDELNGKIVELGGAPVSMSDVLAVDSLAALLARRIDYLKSQEKILDRGSRSIPPKDL